MKRATPDSVLNAAAKTFASRNSTYGNGWARTGELLLFLHGPQTRAPIASLGKTASDLNRLHLWVLLLIKVMRFASSGLRHRDSIHDLVVYGAMIEAELINKEKQL